MIISNAKDKKLVFFTTEAPPSFAGGGRNAYYFAEYLSAFAQRVELICLNYNNKLEPIEGNDRFKVRRLLYYNRNFLAKGFSLLLLIPKYVYHIFRSDIVLVFGAYLIGYQSILFFASLLGKKVIFRSSLLKGDDARSLDQKNSFIRWINRFVMKRIDLYFAINSEFRKLFCQQFGTAVKVFESFQGVDSERFQPLDENDKIHLRAKLGMSKTDFVIVSAGFLVKKKGFHTILPELASLNIPFKYFILGDISSSASHKMGCAEALQTEQLIALGEELLGDQLNFTGGVENIEDYFLAADLFILPSLQEGTPNVLLEAMACGLPVISRKLTGITGKLTQHNINCMEFSDESELQTIITSLYHDPLKRKQLGEAARQTIAEKYTFELVAKELFTSLDA